MPWPVPAIVTVGVHIKNKAGTVILDVEGQCPIGTKVKYFVLEFLCSKVGETGTEPAFGLEILDTIPRPENGVPDARVPGPIHIYGLFLDACDLDAHDYPDMRAAAAEAANSK